MKKCIVMCLIMFVSCLGIQANAAIVYEGFDYTPTDGTLPINGLDGGTGFEGAWYNCYTGTNPDTIVDGVTFGSLDVSGGALARLDRSGSDATARTISGDAQAALTQDNSTIWFSVLMKSTVGNGFAVNSYATLIFGDAGLAGGVATLNAAPQILNSGSAIGVGFQGTVGGTGDFADMRLHGVSYDNGTLNKSTTKLLPPVVGTNVMMIVGKVDWAANGTNDVLSLYNISDPSAALPATAFATINVDLDQSTFNIISIGDAQTSLFDEIRFGSSYADVAPVPEPATMGLLALGGLVLARRRHS